MSVPIRFCSRCHAPVTLDPSAASCPACGGILVADPATNTAASETDHRGIVLPSRHAVGGIITPR